MIGAARITLLVAAAAAISTMLACGGGLPPDISVPEGPSAREWNTAVDSGKTSLTQLLALAATLGSETAKQQMADSLASDSAVERTEITDQGLWIGYRNGTCCMLLLDPLAGSADTLDPFITAESTAGAAPVDDGPFHIAATVGIKSRITRAIVLIPEYSHYKTYADLMLSTMDAGFERMNAPRAERYLDEACTIDRYSSLSGYDLIYFDNHGVRMFDPLRAAPNTFLLTGHRVSGESTWTDVKIKYEGLLALRQIQPVVTDDHGDVRSYLAVAPAFVTSGLNSSGKKTMVWLGFCNSWRGTWATELIDRCGAWVCLGWDKPTFCVAELSLGRKMFAGMCDTTFPIPMTLEFWYANTRVSYFDPTTETTVTLQIQGNQDLAFWEKTDEDVPLCDLAGVRVVNGTDVPIYVSASTPDGASRASMIHEAYGETTLSLAPGHWTLSAEGLPWYGKTWEREIDLTCSGYEWYLDPVSP